MSILEILVLAVSLSLDAFAVALALSAAGHLNNTRASFRISFHFGLFQFIMPVAGWAIGTRFAPYIQPVDHWIAFGLLTFVALHMIWSTRSIAARYAFDDPSRGWLLVTLSTATSIDALAVGLSLAALEVSVWYPSVVIGVSTLTLSILAIVLGRRVSGRIGSIGQVFGAIILILIAVKILISHLM